ncbi:hypothetical protein AQJ91_45835 [Streptomyces dysideae]|uniref:Secreted protein n=1 Tax=Streptomyces dysideae TaxID=909626 RepID=A0A117RXM3_9ACTN|nr:hypothetical protein AQJ91_45835 [Streptomyces dysideae]
MMASILIMAASRSLLIAKSCSAMKLACAAPFRISTPMLSALRWKASAAWPSQCSRTFSTAVFSRPATLSFAETASTPPALPFPSPPDRMLWTCFQ